VKLVQGKKHVHRRTKGEKKIRKGPSWEEEGKPDFGKQRKFFDTWNCWGNAFRSRRGRAYGPHYVEGRRATKARRRARYVVSRDVAKSARARAKNAS